MRAPAIRVCVLIALAGLLAGCGGKGGGKTTAGASAPGCEKVATPAPRRVSLKAPRQDVRPGEKLSAVVKTSCGTGIGTLFLAREFPQARVRGVDISEEMIAEAQAKIGLDPEGRVAFKVADAADLPYDEDSFDLVTQLNMPPFFGEVARVLRPGGYVVMAASYGASTPFYTPAGVLERGFGRHGLHKVSDGEAGSGSYFVARRPS